MSSKPTTARSPGTSRPASRAAFIAPTAIRSAAAKTAVGGHEHDPVDVMMARSPQVRVRAVVAARARLLGREEQDVIAARADPVLHADEDILEERVADVGVLVTREEGDADQLRAAAHE